MLEEQEQQFLRHEPCPSCGSRNNLGRYSDGHGYCFSCEYYEPPTDGSSIQRKAGTKKMSKDLIEIGEYRHLSKRGISETTCSFWSYSVSSIGGKTVQVANYKDLSGGSIIAQKVRFPNKEFSFLGETKGVPLYGQWLWASTGKMVIVTEGEIDALTVSQLQGNKWPVVSIPNGAQGAKKAIQNHLEWLEGYETVVFMFDNDEPGLKAAKECANLLTVGKAKIAYLPLKDPNEMLLAGRGDEVIRAIWNAKVYRPDGIIAGDDLWEAITSTEDDGDSIPYPWGGLNEKTHGLRKGELATFTAGSGIGKSLACREIAYNLIKQGEKVGYIALEENVKRTALGLMGLHLNKPLHISREGVSEEELREAFESTLSGGKVYLYDHFGSLDSGNLLNRIRYLVKGCGCGWIVLDHLSIVVSGMGEGDERRLIDNTMTALRSLVEELGVGMILVSHLKRPEGKGHEEGAKTSLAQLRGSAAIAQLSDMVLGLERNQQSEEDSDITCVRVLKNRFSGETGEACYLKYFRDTGRLLEGSKEFSSEDSEGGFSVDSDF